MYCSMNLSNASIDSFSCASLYAIKFNIKFTLKKMESLPPIYIKKIYSAWKEKLNTKKDEKETNLDKSDNKNLFQI